MAKPSIVLIVLLCSESVVAPRMASFSREGFQYPLGAEKHYKKTEQFKLNISMKKVSDLVCQNLQSLINFWQFEDADVKLTRCTRMSVQVSLETINFQFRVAYMEILGQCHNI